MRNITFCAVLSLLLVLCGIRRADWAAASRRDEAPGLTIRGVAERPVSISLADLDRLPAKTVRVKDAGGNSMEYEGVALAEVMKRAGMAFEPDRHGRGLTRYLLAEAADKYRTVFALPEFDPEFMDRTILVATRRDGKPLPESEGPLRLIVPDDKRQARWVRQLRVLSLIDAVSPADRNQKP